LNLTSGGVVEDNSVASVESNGANCVHVHLHFRAVIGLDYEPSHQGICRHASSTVVVLQPSSCSSVMRIGFYEAAKLRS
jgi:hypothetical protein